MRILRLSNSDDTHPDVADEDRSYRLTERAIEAATGEPVETICRDIWPGPELPDIVEGWLTRYEPDVVIFLVSGYWFTFVNLPDAPRPRWKPARKAGRLAARLGIKSPVVYRIGKVRRHLLTWRSAGSTAFEPQEVIARSDAVIRRVLRHEEITLVVGGSRYPNVSQLSRTILARGEARRLMVHRALKNLCAQLYIPYTGIEDGLEYVRQGHLCADGLHQNAKAHARMATEETEAILAETARRGR